MMNEEDKSRLRSMLLVVTSLAMLIHKPTKEMTDWQVNEKLDDAANFIIDGLSRSGFEIVKKS